MASPKASIKSLNLQNQEQTLTAEKCWTIENLDKSGASGSKTVKYYIRDNVRLLSYSLDCFLFGLRPDFGKDYRTTTFHPPARVSREILRTASETAVFEVTGCPGVGITCFMWGYAKVRESYGESIIWIHCEEKGSMISYYCNGNTFRETDEIDQFRNLFKKYLEDGISIVFLDGAPKDELMVLLRAFIAESNRQFKLIISSSIQVKKSSGSFEENYQTYSFTLLSWTRQEYSQAYKAGSFDHCRRIIELDIKFSQYHMETRNAPAYIQESVRSKEELVEELLDDAFFIVGGSMRYMHSILDANGCIPSQFLEALHILSTRGDERAYPYLCQILEKDGENIASFVSDCAVRYFLIVARNLFIDEFLTTKFDQSCVWWAFQCEVIFTIRQLVGSHIDFKLEHCDSIFSFFNSYRSYNIQFVEIIDTDCNITLKNNTFYIPLKWNQGC